jgi:EAL domain-containing protein (putative c-di-GMP-specific phosphodiesterase class I)
MYSAKQNGRDNYQFFDADMNAHELEQQSLKSQLRNAVEPGEFVLHYQPMIDLQSKRTVGVEALIRWAHPRRGLLLPNQFIPLAEESALIVPMGKWVVQEACRQGRAWLDSGLAPINIVRMRVVAEGIETRRQFEMLREQDCVRTGILFRPRHGTGRGG